MWNIIQCTFQGRWHIKENIPCQDKTFSLNSDNFFAAALADGAGSARLSHFGAERITRYVCTCMSERFSDFYAEKDANAFKHRFLGGINSELEILADKMSCNIKDLASTLLVVSVKDDQYIMLHIGDGVIGYLKKNELKVASNPENGDFANVTVFTTSENAAAKMKIIKGNLGTIDGFVLMSDGSEASFYNKADGQSVSSMKKW